MGYDILEPMIQVIFYYCHWCVWGKKGGYESLNSITYNSIEDEIILSPIPL